MNPSQKPESLEPEIEVTRLFCEWRDGSATALEALTPLLYQELHRIAARYMQRERAEHTLQATALVNEAFLQIFIAGPDRVPAGSKFDPQDRVHFLALA